jgi:hypothetical protein
MTDQPPIAAAPVAVPITVNATPTLEQVSAGLRYGLMAVAAVAGTLGYSHVAGQASALLMAVAPVAGFVVFIWGQIVTRKTSQKAATMANALPNSVAQTR